MQRTFAFLFCVLCVWDRWIYSNIEDTFSHFWGTRYMMEYLSWFYAQLEPERLIVGRTSEWILIGMFGFIYWIMHERLWMEMKYVRINWAYSEKTSEWFWESGQLTKRVPRSISDVVPLYKRRTTTQIYLSQSWDKAIHRNSHWMEETINFLSSSHKTPINHHSQVHFCSQSNSHFTNRKSRSKEIQPPICKGKIPIIQPSQNKNDCRVV